MSYGNHKSKQLLILSKMVGVVETSLGFYSEQSAYNFVDNEGIYSMGEVYKSHT